MSFSVEIKGLNELIRKMDRLPNRLKAEISATIENGAKVFVRNAKRDAPKDFGQLTGSIGYVPISTMNFEVFAAKEYAPYMEWGTILHVDVPAELKAYAIQFKGRDIRKTGGIIARPYFFKQIPIVKKQIEAGINAIVTEEKL